MADTAIISLRIIISYAQHRVFPKSHDSTPRWAIVTHQRAGKAVAAAAKLIRAAAACNPRYGYVTPYLGQAKEIACLRCYSEPLWVEPPNETNGGSSR